MNRSDRLALDKTVDPVLFYSEKDEWGDFSNFSRHSIWLPSPWTGLMTLYRTSEHRFQALKATNRENHDRIVAYTTPSEAKDAGREITLRDYWGDKTNTICWFVMVEALFAKTIQHDEVRRLLATTENRHMYEDSAVDDIWGWRYRNDYRGRNLLGKAWMLVRGTYRAAT